MPENIPFNKPFIAGRELFYISQAVLDGQLAGDGRFTRLCQEWMEDKFSAGKVLLTHSCTGALEIAALLADLQPDDEVIMPSYTFVSTANAFALRGATIRFVDIRPDTLNMDEALVEAAITEKTRAIVPVHYAGISCEMDSILALANRHDLLVIEDAAQGVNSTYKSKFLGTMGHLGAYSFHETKNFICGEGGALVINDQRFIDRAEILRDKGTDRTRFFRGEVEKYTWLDIGSSYPPSELVAAFLYAQLEESETITQKRWAIYNYYAHAFAPLHERHLLTMPTCPQECHHNAHMFYLLLSSREERDQLIHVLRLNNINSVFHYVPLHDSPMGRAMGYKPGDLPVTVDISSRLIRLPCYFDLSRQQQDRIIHVVTSFLCDLSPKRETLTKTRKMAEHMS